MGEDAWGSFTALQYDWLSAEVRFSLSPSLVLSLSLSRVRSLLSPPSYLPDSGAFLFVCLLYQGGNAFQTIFRVYDSVNAITFEQKYLSSASHTAVSSRDDVISSFPAFTVSSNDAMPLAYLSYFGNMAMHQQIAPFCADAKAIPGGLANGGPFVLFEATAQEAVVFSPLNNFMAGSLTQVTRGTLITHSTAHPAHSMHTRTQHRAPK